MNKILNDIYERVAVVIPTYNEAGNIGRVIDELLLVFRPRPNKYFNIIVVDDNSPDGTADIVRSRIESIDQVSLIIQDKKMGIGAAYMKGFQYAVNELRADIVIEFDADMQHPPKSVLQLVDKINEGNDFVIGSRNVSGGYKQKRGLLRSGLTDIGGMVARFILFFPNKYFRQVTDPTSGLRATRVKDVLGKIDIRSEHLHSRGFGYKMQTLSEILDMSVRYAEIPLHFDERYSGESKMTATTFLEVLSSCIYSRIMQKDTNRFIKFGIVGSVGYLVNATALYLIASMSFWEPLSWALATELAIVSNFTLNNIWTFGTANDSVKKSVFYKFAQFNLSSIGAILIQAIFGTVGVHILGPEYRQLILPFIVVILIMPYNWLMYSRVIWRNRS